MSYLEPMPGVVGHYVCPVCYIVYCQSSMIHVSVHSFTSICLSSSSSRLPSLLLARETSVIPRPGRVHIIVCVCLLLSVCLSHYVYASLIPPSLSFTPPFSLSRALSKLYALFSNLLTNELTNHVHKHGAPQKRWCIFKLVMWLL